MTPFIKIFSVIHMMLILSVNSFLTKKLGYRILAHSCLKMSTKVPSRRYQLKPQTSTSTSSSSSSLNNKKVIPASSEHILPPKVVLEKGKARLFQDGNPLVYGGAVKELIGLPQSGDRVLVTDHMGNEIGIGIYNSNSTYRVRMFTRSYEKEHTYSFEELLIHRIQQALSLRKRAGLPSKINTAFRAINGEGDRLSGLIVDIFDKTVVVQSGALWIEVYRNSIETALLTVLNEYHINSSSTSSSSKKKKSSGEHYRVIWRPAEARLKQDGYNLPNSKTSNNSNKSDIMNEDDEGNSDEIDDIESYLEDVKKDPEDNKKDIKPLIILENKVKYVVEPDDGQKTGFYCDQRDNRRLIRELSQDKTILDTYCYSGGFSINAALGGAKSVTAIDSSQLAITTAETNAKLNEVDDVITCIKADAVEYMRKQLQDGQSYDIVICDPPKLAPTRSSLPRAKNKYIKINTLGLSLVKPGGYFLTCSCSAAVTQTKALPDILLEAARIARRDVTVLSTTSTGCDHPVHLNYPEGAYLTAILVCVH